MLGGCRSCQRLEFLEPLELLDELLEVFRDLRVTGYLQDPYHYVTLCKDAYKLIVNHWQPSDLVAQHSLKRFEDQGLMSNCCERCAHNGFCLSLEGARVAGFCA